MGLLTLQVDMSEAEVVLPKSLEHGGHLAAGKKLMTVVPRVMELIVCSNPRSFPFVLSKRNAFLSLLGSPDLLESHSSAPNLQSCCLSKTQSHSKHRFCCHQLGIEPEMRAWIP